MIRLGDYREVLGDVMADAIITDPPYSERTHAGHDAGAESATHGPGGRQKLSYTAWSEDDVFDFADWSVEHCRGWICALTDHLLAPAFSDRLEHLGRYVFAPLPLFSPGSTVRLLGDGPSSWTCWLVVARPRTAEFAKWGTLPGGYVVPPERGDEGIVGGKPLAAMRAIVRDYSRPGDLICDPCAGAGTTLRAAEIERRRGIGAEINPETFGLARRRIAKALTVSML